MIVQPNSGRDCRRGGDRGESGYQPTSSNAFRLRRNVFQRRQGRRFRHGIGIALDWVNRLRRGHFAQAAQNLFGQIGGHRHVGESRLDRRIGPLQPLESRAKLVVFTECGRQFDKLGIVQIATCTDSTVSAVRLHRFQYLALATCRVLH